MAKKHQIKIIAERWSDDPVRDRAARSWMVKARDVADQCGEAFVVFVGSLPVFSSDNLGTAQNHAREERGGRWDVRGKLVDTRDDVSLKRFGPGWFKVPESKV
ncbi:MAG: hypothetical protein U1A72_23205 [Sulfuritalea sp.]|nr:hypothetical protein [Sulfuritalea sp.]